ncbi:MAG: class I SAM-dependent methyltransferase [Anaerolineaceae bacterium]
MKSVPNLNTLHLEEVPGWSDYHLLDSGEGKTLEQFGPYLLIRPEAQAIWSKSNKELWKQAHAMRVEESKEYGGHWNFLKPMEKSWELGYKNLRCQLQVASSRHIGIFPEQSAHWDWMSERIKLSKKPFKVLNLFGYTGLASLAAAAAGAEVTHVDSSKHALNWASYNMKLSGLENKPVRWIADDALKFAQREARRGNTYQGLILDPPKFGRGLDGQVWDFFKKMPELIDACRQILATDADFVVLTAYAISASAVITAQSVEAIAGNRGIIETGELVMRDESAGHMLSHALYSRWKSK